MLFTTAQHILFLPLVIIHYSLTPNCWRLVLLTAVSYCFYAIWMPALLLITVGFKYLDGVALHGYLQPAENTRRVDCVAHYALGYVCDCARYSHLDRCLLAGTALFTPAVRDRINLWYRASVKARYLALLVIMMVLLMPDSQEPFICFQF